jgi:hypothetical protein
LTAESAAERKVDAMTGFHVLGLLLGATVLAVGLIAEVWRAERPEFACEPIRES